MRRCGKHFAEIQRVKRPVDQQQRNQETEITDPVYQEGFLAGLSRFRLAEVETNQQVGAQAHAFPPGKQQQVVAAEYQNQHEKQEQVHAGKKPVVSTLVGHVADGVDVDQQTHAGNHQRHHGGKGVELKIEAGAETCCDDPRRMRFEYRQRAQHPDGAHRKKKGQRHAAERHRGHARLRRVLACEAVPGGAGERQCSNQPEVIVRFHRLHRFWALRAVTISWC